MAESYHAPGKALNTSQSSTSGGGSPKMAKHSTFVGPLDSVYVDSLMVRCGGET